MILKIPVEDRVSTYKGRVTLTPVTGETNKYDMTRADEPITVGTPINKELLDSKAYTLTRNATIYVSPTGNNTEGDGGSDAPYKTIQKAIDSIPKHLGGYTVTIDIQAGTYNEKLSIEGFSAGKIVVGVSGRSVTVREIEIKSSSFVELNISNITKSTSFSGKLLLVDYGSVALLNANMTIDAKSDTTEAITVQNNSLLTTSNNHVLTVSNCASGVLYARLGARVSLGTIEGTGNAIGLAATLGAIVSYQTHNLTSDFGDSASAGGAILSPEGANGLAGGGAKYVALTGSKQIKDGESVSVTLSLPDGFTFENSMVVAAVSYNYTSAVWNDSLRVAMAGGTTQNLTFTLKGQTSTSLGSSYTYYKILLCRYE